MSRWWWWCAHLPSGWATLSFFQFHSKKYRTVQPISDYSLVNPGNKGPWHCRLDRHLSWPGCFPLAGVNIFQLKNRRNITPPPTLTKSKYCLRLCLTLSSPALRSYQHLRRSCFKQASSTTFFQHLFDIFDWFRERCMKKKVKKN